MRNTHGAGDVEVSRSSWSEFKDIGLTFDKSLDSGVELRDGDTAHAAPAIFGGGNFEPNWNASLDGELSRDKTQRRTIGSFDNLCLGIADSGSDIIGNTLNLGGGG